MRVEMGKFTEGEIERFADMLQEVEGLNNWKIPPKGRALSENRPNLGNMFLTLFPRNSARYKQASTWRDQ